LDGVANHCGSFKIHYQVRDEENREASAERTVRVLATNQCALDKKSPYAARCHHYAKCIFLEQECTYACECLEGYAGNGFECRDVRPPVIEFDVNEGPLRLVRCKVCSMQVGSDPNPFSLDGALAHIRAYDETPDGRVILNDKITVNARQLNDSFYEHVYTVRDEAGNEATATREVIIVEEDVATILQELIRDYEQRKAETAAHLASTDKATSRLTWLFFATVVFLLVLASKFIIDFAEKLIILIRVTSNPNAEWQEYLAAKSFWYRLRHPTMDSQLIARKIYKEYYVDRGEVAQ